jgi:hypothetical protein
MDCPRGESPGGHRLPLGEAAGPITSEEDSGLREWRGRSWLPDDGQRRPDGKSRPGCDDGWAGELTMERLVPGASEALGGPAERGSAP